MCVFSYSRHNQYLIFFSFPLICIDPSSKFKMNNEAAFTFYDVLRNKRMTGYFQVRMAISTSLSNSEVNTKELLFVMN